MTAPPLKINCIGLKCPLPALRMERTLKAGEAHFILETDDPVSIIDIPLALKNWPGHTLSQSSHNGIYQFEITLTIT